MARRYAADAKLVRSYPGRYADQAMREPWSPPGGKSNLNQGGPRRFFDWGRDQVVENAGFQDAYFRRMTDQERGSALICRQTGELVTGVKTYSEITQFVTFRDGRQSVTRPCGLACEAT